MPLHPDFQKILTKFKQRYGDEEGERLFYMWVNKHKLDPDKPYSVQAQIMRECLSGICEAFQWAGPLIQLLREDGDAKYYKSIALTANISANFNDYSDVVELERASSTLTWRPLNLNHDHGAFLPFPEARVDWAAFENDAVEAIIRIPNTLRHIQRMIENGDIIHVSIEGEPRTGVRNDEGVAPQWYNFTALALLEKDKTLPGDQLTTIEPLFIRESMGRSLVESLRLGEETKEKEETMTDETINTETSLDDTTEKPELEEMNQGTCGQCGQCRFFNEYLPTVKKEPNVMASEPSDGYVITIEGGIGPGVGECTVSNKLVRKNDAACYDGRLRDTPTSADDDERIIETVDELIMKKKVEDLETEVLDLKRKYNDAIAEHATTKGEVADAQRTIATKDKEIAVQSSKISRLESVKTDLDSKLDNIQNTHAELQVAHDRLSTDVTFMKETLERKEAILDSQRKDIAQLKDDLAEAMTKANDESAKRAEAVQRANDATDREAKVLRDNAILSEDLASERQKTYDLSVRGADQAKEVLKLQREKTEAKTHFDTEKANLTEDVRSLKQKLGKFEKLKKIIVKT